MPTPRETTPADLAITVMDSICMMIPVGLMLYLALRARYQSRSIWDVIRATAKSPIAALVVLFWLCSLFTLMLLRMGRPE